jgi:Putative transposase, YhgA-like
VGDRCIRYCQRFITLICPKLVWYNLSCTVGAAARLCLYPGARRWEEYCHQRSRSMTICATVRTILSGACSGRAADSTSTCWWSFRQQSTARGRSVSWPVGALLYGGLIRSQQLNPAGDLPPVVPIALYKGRNRWTAAPDAATLVAEAPGGLAVYRSQLQYLLIDARRYT